MQIYYNTDGGNRLLSIFQAYSHNETPNKGIKHLIEKLPDPDQRRRVWAL